MRRLTVGLLVIGLLVGAAPAFATDDLAPFLVEQAAAEFSGISRRLGEAYPDVIAAPASESGAT